MAPTEFKAWERAGTTVELVQRTLPAVGENDVLVRVRSVTLNFRDILIMLKLYPIPVAERGIPCSDGACEVVSVGSKVTKWKTGDRVSPNFSLTTITGDEAFLRKMEADLGGNVDGMLAEYRVLPAESLVKIPDNLSWDEAAALPCAGLTAWRALSMPEVIDSGKTVLLLGTGGVSMCALQLCLAGGLRPIITSSSDAKLAAIKALAPDVVQTINYKTHPEWSQEVLRLTGGQGADIVVENGGPATLHESIKALKGEGLISLIGALAGLDEQPGIVAALFMKLATIRAVKVGSRTDFEKMTEFLAKRKVDLKPTIDEKKFAFADAPAAIEYLQSRKHTGKIVIAVS